MLRRERGGRPKLRWIFLAVCTEVRKGVSFRFICVIGTVQSEGVIVDGMYHISVFVFISVIAVVN